MGIRPRGQRVLGRDQELEEAEEDPQESARRVLGEHRPERRARHDPWPKAGQRTGPWRRRAMA